MERGRDPVEPEPESLDRAPRRSTSVAVCKEHGLRYDPALADGCVLCRRATELRTGQGRGRTVTAAAVTLGFAIGVGALAVALAPRLLSDGDQEGNPTVDLAHVDAPRDDGSVEEGFERVDATVAVTAGVLLARWGIEVFRPQSAEWATPGGTRGQRPEPGALDRFGRRLVAVLQLYPVPYVKRSGLRRVMLLEDFHHRGVELPLMAMGPYGTIAADVKVDNLRILHHEVFHLVDYQIFGDPPPSQPWMGLNRPGFQYSGSARQMIVALRHTGLSELTDAHPGFISRYATATAVEDRAELFSALVTHPAYVRRRCEHDPVLRAKAEYLRRRVAEWEPSMGSDFWASVESR